MHRVLVLLATSLAGMALAVSASAAIGTSFPTGFATPTDASLGTPVLGFGAAGEVERNPVILLHGNNDTPYPTLCNPYGDVHDLAGYLESRGYRPSELWGLGYQGDQCDLITTPTNRSGVAHSTLANVPDLRAFVHAVLDFTGAKRVDIVGHSLGGTLAREWMRQDHAYHLVRHLVTIDSPHHGIINCSPSPLNYFQLPAAGGFTPDSAICREYGADDTPFLATLNRKEAKGPTRYLAIRNSDRSFVYFPTQDGAIAPVPAQDRTGAPHDFSQSAALAGNRVVNVDLVGQGAFDPILGTAHLGILNSPATRELVAEFLDGKHDD
ncbi:MAG TPA: alpha/beta fold hydrolase [Gaiellaceae bacterium]|nr:alpha/beta fold hydrolase [Gaiellaceae bacterium]